MANHSCKELDRLLEKAIEAGFTIKKEGIFLKIYPPDKKIPFYSGHHGERGFHPIRRYFKNVCKVKL